MTVCLSVYFTDDIFKVGRCYSYVLHLALPTVAAHHYQIFAPGGPKKAIGSAEEKVTRPATLPSLQKWFQYK